jgi:alpha,alpha-trehalase
LELRFTFRIRRGPNDIYLNECQEWVNSIQIHGAGKVFADPNLWKTSWSKGIYVFDPTIDTQIASDFQIPPKNYHEPSPETITTNNNKHQNDSTDCASILSITAKSFTLLLTPTLFTSLSTHTQSQIQTYLWCPTQSLFVDYSLKTRSRTTYESATSLWALWSQIATPTQASLMVPRALKLFEVSGGLVSTTAESRGPLGPNRPPKQWDYPFGWAPHQILAWKGLHSYGFEKECQRLVYKWLHMMLTSFVDYNGVVPEKFDVVRASHLMEGVEYGNVGTDFRYVVREGFGWMNASFQVSKKKKSGKTGLRMCEETTWNERQHSNTSFY